MSDLPLDETALQAAARATWEAKPTTSRRLGWDQLMPSAQDRVGREIAAGVSTYLRETRFETQIDDASKHGYDGPKTHRLVGPWVPVVQAESEGE